MHTEDCIESVTGELVFIKAIHVVDWVKAIDQRTGMADQDYVSLAINCVVANTEDHSTEEREFILLIKPDGAHAIVRGIADLLEGPPPTTIYLPGRN